MNRAESIKRRKERLPWTRDEIRLWIDELAENLDEWDAIIGEPSKGSELWEFKQVLGEVTSKLSRLAFGSNQWEIKAAAPIPCSRLCADRAAVGRGTRSARRNGGVHRDLAL